MQKDDIGAVIEVVLPDEIDETGHGFGNVERDLEAEARYAEEDRAELVEWLAAERPGFDPSTIVEVDPEKGGASRVFFIGDEVVKIVPRAGDTKSVFDFKEGDPETVAGLTAYILTELRAEIGDVCAGTDLHR